MGAIKGLGQRARGPADHEVRGKNAGSLPEDFVGCFDTSAAIRPVDDVVLKQASVVGNLDGSRQTHHLHVLLCLDEGNRCFWMSRVDCLSECKQNGGAEILAFKLQVVQASLANVAVACAEYVLHSELFGVLEVLRNQVKRIVGRDGFQSLHGLRILLSEGRLDRLSQL